MSDPLAEARKLAEAGMHREAAEACRAAGASGAEASELKSLAHEKLGEPAEAARHLQRALSGSSDPQEICRLGELWFKAAKYAKAANAADRALKSAPGDPAATALKARALVCQDRHAQALQCCGPEPSDPRVQAAAGRALYETGRTEEAGRLCAQACAAPGFAARFYAALCSQGSEAERLFAEALKEPPDVDSPRARTGRALLALGRTGEALAELGGGDDPKSACIRGQALQEAGRLSEALAAFREAARRRAENSEDMYHAALACHRLGLEGDRSWHARARKILKDARARNPGIPGAAKLARALEEQVSRLQEAEKKRLEREPAAPEPKPEPRPRPARRKARKPRPRPEPEIDADRIIRQAAESCAPGKCKDALAALDRLPADAALRAGAQFCKGMAYYGLARYEEAHTCFERADKAEPRLQYRYWRAMSLYRQGLSGMLEGAYNTKAERYREAKRLLDKITSADPLYPGARTLTGLAEHHISNTIKSASGDDSARSFREALKIDPSDVVALYHLGQAREREGRMPEANELYDRAVNAEAAASGFLCDPPYCKGYAQDLLGQHEAALTGYQEALLRDPDYGPGFAREAIGARGREVQGGRGAARDEDLEVCVVDANVAMPHLARSKLGFDPPDWVHLAYHRRRFWKRFGEGSYVVPDVCRNEILRTLRDKLPQMAPGAGRGRAVMDDVRAKLDGAPRTRWSEAVQGVGPADVMRVKRAYWLAWFRMHPDKKNEWVRKKRAGGRRLDGGPPRGAGDTRILAAAAKLASAGARAGLVTDDNDFLMFRSVADELGVRVVRV